MKVFDKLQRDGDRTKTQTSDVAPNVLLLSFWPIFGSPLPFSPAIGWALDELLSGQPNMGAVKQMPPGAAVPDISLNTFLKREWPSTYLELIECPSRLSGALLFNCVGLQGGRVNYNAGKAHEISHAEMVLMERIFSPLRGWEHLGGPWPVTT
jgi:hypothetical protein